MTMKLCQTPNIFDRRSFDAFCQFAESENDVLDNNHNKYGIGAVQIIMSLTSKSTGKSKVENKWFKWLDNDAKYKNKNAFS